MKFNRKKKLKLFLRSYSLIYINKNPIHSSHDQKRKKSVKKHRDMSANIKELEKSLKYFLFSEFSEHFS